MLRVYRYVLPGVREQLRNWRTKAEAIPDPELRVQAIASMTSKEFHCIGGSVYAVANLPMRHVLIPLIVAFQTISDYLDNLCDRSTSLDPEDFRRLHQSMLDAVDPGEPLHDYYEFRVEKDDGGYLNELVKTCQASLRMLPSYSAVADAVRELTGLYCDLQVYKHIRKDLREKALLDWWDKHRDPFPQIGWNEFAAATGSTLGIFMLFLSASDPSLDGETVKAIREAYFPYLCGLHILLDYLIDQEEDIAGGDLNFCSYYADLDETVARIAFVVKEARTRSEQLAHPEFHRMIIEGLLALYLSDPKVSKQRQVKQISRQLMKDSPLMRMFFFINSVWIRKTS
ncbi:tetraprenyl-beta-curcumene synthase family protein [Paenibacillus filicis]|uniref:Tetraprenyl-beta-curcumene synthase family protein n=1 Tax=Paenibacillus gyeongsangnamensis TaxID=3388067 RepID=A0ABT4Q5A9_9BACL|nr:tetraprenyl-beta-curcumene synthase family protein [Paenibacillus filicis]MCZ8512067.1 tetraprenyl-beta-curcumene synthase family protein [Paenibacillus filicis]